MGLGDNILATVASVSSRYIWRKLWFEYRPSVPSTASGNINFAYASFPNPVASFEQQSKLINPVMVHISSPLLYKMPCNPEAGSYLTNETGDMRHVVDQYLHISWNATDSWSTATVNAPGQLFVTYEVELYGQRPEPIPLLDMAVSAVPVTAINVHTEGTDSVCKRVQYTYADSAQKVGGCMALEVAEETDVGVGAVMLTAAPGG